MRKGRFDAAERSRSGEAPRLIADAKTDVGRRHMASAEALVRSFNTWSFKREQPDNPERLMRLAVTAVAEQTPLAFVLYWGRGPRAKVADAERRCLDFLAALSQRVASRHAPGADVTLICTDTHAELNGRARSSTERYFAEVDREARGRGFRTCFLSDVLVATQDRIDTTQAEAPAPPEFLNGLMVSAAKWYAGGGSVEEGALRYYRANMLERQAVEAAFPEAIFITFNGSDLRPLLPDGMPIFYMYSIRRGVSVKPWFMPADATLLTAPREPEIAQ